MTPNIQQKTLQEWFENLKLLLLERLSEEAERLKINENNALFRKIEREIITRSGECVSKIVRGMKAKTTDFVREMNSLINSLSHVMEWDKLVGF